MTLRLNLNITDNERKVIEDQLKKAEQKVEEMTLDATFSYYDGVVDTLEWILGIDTYPPAE